MHLALLYLQHPPVPCFAAHTPSLSHVPSLLPAVAAMRAADVSAAHSPPPCRGCARQDGPRCSQDTGPALRGLFGKGSGLRSEAGRPLACWAGGTASLLPACLQWPRPQPPRRAAPQHAPAPPQPSPGDGCLFFKKNFFFFPSFFFPSSCSETFSYVHFSPVELIYELGLARAGVAGSSAGRAARGRGAPAGLPSRAAHVSPPDMSCNFRQTFEGCDICTKARQLPAASMAGSGPAPPASSPAICVSLISCC